MKQTSAVSRALVEAVRRPVHTPDALHAWVRLYTGLSVPRTPVCPNHSAPFDYLIHAYFEPTRDQIVVAPRGGGKTRLAAVATLLDLMHKPGCAVRLLGGSLEQSLRVWEHLAPDVERVCASDLPPRGLSPSARRIKLRSGANVSALAQSQRAVRGLRVQKLRCDEVELFDPAVWEAAQLVTRSLPHARATIEAISTHHLAGGLMSKLIDEAQASGTRVTRWCLLEVLQKCEPERDCPTCTLWPDCRGVAKTHCDGFVPIDDAVRMMTRVSRETWESEMLCKRPGVRGRVFPTFDVALHVREGAGVGNHGSRTTSGASNLGMSFKDCETTSEKLNRALSKSEPGFANPACLSLAVDFGFHNPFVCLWIETSSRDGQSVTHVMDEYVQSGRTVDEHALHIEARAWGKVRRLACDPAGAGSNDQTAESNVKLLRRRGYKVEFRASRIVEGVEMIRTTLSNGAGRTSLFVHPRCVKLIRALQHYRYPDAGGELPLKDGEHDHLIDALRYHFVNAPGRFTHDVRSY